MSNSCKAKITVWNNGGPVAGCRVVAYCYRSPDGGTTWVVSAGLYNLPPASDTGVDGVGISNLLTFGSSDSELRRWHVKLVKYPGWSTTATSTNPTMYLTGADPATGWLVGPSWYISSLPVSPDFATHDFGPIDVVDNTVPETRSISGTISGITPGEEPFVVVKLTMGTTFSMSTAVDSDGDYLFQNLTPAEDYIITPESPKYTFSATHLHADTRLADATGKNFTATAIPPVVTYRITGVVKLSGSPTACIPGVTVGYTDGGSQSGSVVTDSTGSFMISGLTPATFALSGAKEGYTFNGPIDVTITASDVYSNGLVGTPDIGTGNIVGNVSDIFDDIGDLNLFTNDVDAIDFDVLNNRLYIATGTNHLLRWNGSGSAEKVSDVWEDNYAYPSLVKAYAGRLACTGFVAPGIPELKNELRFTVLDEPSILSENIFIIRTADTETPTAMMTLTPRTNEGPLGSFIRAGIIIAKSSSMTLFMGDDLTDYSDVSIVSHSRVGCAGPQAWDYIPGGIAFVGDDGVFSITGPEPATPLGSAIRPMFGMSTMSSAPVRRINKNSLRRSSLAYDVLEGGICVAVPLINSADHDTYSEITETLPEGQPVYSYFANVRPQWIILNGSQNGAWAEWDTLTTSASYPLFVRYDRDDRAVVALSTAAPVNGLMPRSQSQIILVVGPLWDKSRGKGTSYANDLSDQWGQRNSGEMEVSMAFTALGDPHRPKRVVSCYMDMTGDNVDTSQFDVSMETWIDDERIDVYSKDLLDNGRSLLGSATLGASMLSPYKKSRELFPMVAAAKGFLIKHVFRAWTSGRFKIHSFRIRFAQNAKVR